MLNKCSLSTSNLLSLQCLYMYIYKYIKFIKVVLRRRFWYFLVFLQVYVLMNSENLSVTSEHEREEVAILLLIV